MPGALIDLHLAENARQQMLRRDITLEQVLVTATEPDRTTFALGYIVHCFKEIGGRTIRVTYNAASDYVITVSLAGTRR